jgi:hypothetical protein
VFGATPLQSFSAADNFHAMTMRHNLVVVPLIPVVAVIVSTFQEPGATWLTPSDLQTDFAIARAALREGHGGLTRYATSAELDSAFAHVERSLDRPMTTIEFYRSLAPIFVTIACGHTELLLPRQLQRRITDSLPLLPVRIFVKGNRAFVLREYVGDSSLIGREIRSINGMPASEIVRRLSLVAHGDGHTATATARRLNDGLTFNELLFPAANIFGPFSVELMTSGSQRPSVVLPGKTGTTLRDAQASLYPEDGPDSNAATYRLRDGDSVGVLTIRSFDDWADAAHTRRLGPFLDEVFAALERQHTRSLVLDLRDNGGGNDELAQRLVEHLLDKPFDYYSDLRMTSLSSTLFARDSRIENARFRRDAAGVYHRLDYPGVGRQAPRRPVFAGRLIVLENGGSFSATSEAMSILRYNRRGTFVGEEGGGGFSGNTSGFGASVVLPHSGIKMDVPRLTYYLAVSGSPPDRGVMPDVAISETVSDILARRDPVLDAALVIARKR